MSDEREHKTIQTPGGHKVVLKTYITGREARDIKNVFLNNMTLKQTSQGNEVDGIKGPLTVEAEDMAYKAVIISLDGSADDLINRILDLPFTETEFIKKAVEEVTSPMLDDAKKKV